MKANELRQKYLDFFRESPRDHQIIKHGPIVLENDPTTLFTSSGMQPLVPYLLGEEHPKGKRLVNSQPSVRAHGVNDDILEVGDNRHLTIFEMLGNWSLGDYFKKEQLPWIYEFLTKELAIPKHKLWVTVFKGNEQVSRDTTSINIWKEMGIPQERIKEYGVGKNWWSRTGPPSAMPVGDIGGPTSEIFYEYENVDHDPVFGEECHVNCDCGRFLEIGNSVFMQYKKVGPDKLEELPNKNIDFGGGLERLVAAANNEIDIFRTDLFLPLIKLIEADTGVSYEIEDKKSNFRVIADHLKSSTFFAACGVKPSNKEHGYILRRLLRRGVAKVYRLNGDTQPIKLFKELAEETFNIYEGTYLSKEKEKKVVFEVIEQELEKFSNTLQRGLRELNKVDRLDYKSAFNLYQTHGLPIEITLEIAEDKGKKLDLKKFKEEMGRHKELSRTASAGKFKGGLVDESEETIRLHTATHLLQAVLREVLGDHVVQKGQNITQKRSRFDFNHDKKLTDQEIKRLSDLINEKIEEDLPVNKEKMSIEEAEKTGAIHAFGEKYGDIVTVYSIGDTSTSSGQSFSREFCGGPHVASTGDIGRVKIKRQEKIGANVVRIYLEFE